MSIITKSNVTKGTPSQFTLNKLNLLEHPIVQADLYFSNLSNWYRVNLIYKSSAGSQYEIVEFDASQATPTGTFLISEKARDEFQIQKVQIMDFDGGFLDIPRSELVVADLDVTIQNTPSDLSPLVYAVNASGFTKLTNGGLQSTGGTSLTLSQYITTSDFTLIFKFNAEDAIQDAFYGITNNNFIGFRIWNNVIEAYASFPRNSTSTLQVSNTVELSKVGTLLTWTINGVVVFSENSSELVSPYDIFIRTQANGILLEAYLVN